MLKNNATLPAYHLESSLSIHICTKDKPGNLRDLLRDVSLLELDKLQVYIYDDSTRTTNRYANRQAAKEMPYKTVYFDEQRRQKVLQDFPWPSLRAKLYGEYAFKSFGKPEWDPAGIRSFAHFIAASCAAPQDALLFLDDDIRLTSATFQKQHHTVNFSAVKATLSQPLETREIVGAAYVGRTDLGLLQHMGHAYTKNHRTNSIPAYNGESNPHPEGGPAISGAFLLTYPEVIRDTAPAHIYNEDWIFITQSKYKNVTIRLALFQPIHKGEETLLPRIKVAQKQLVGDVFFRALHAALQTTRNETQLIDVAISHCPYFAFELTKKWQAMLSDTDFIASIDWKQNDIQQLLDDHHLTTEATAALRLYFELAPGWNDLFEVTCRQYVKQCIL